MAYLPTVLHCAGHVRILIIVPRYTRIKKMSGILKNPLKFFRIFPHFQFFDDFIYRVFINIVFHQYSASNGVFDLRAFLLQIHSSFLKMADRKKQKCLIAYDLSWVKDFPIGPALQEKDAFYCHPCQKVIFCGHMGRGDVAQHCDSKGGTVYNKNVKYINKSA